MKKFFNEFKEFVMRGNVVDMAVGVVIGGAFREIITALVNCIITPLISILIGKVNLAQLQIKISDEVFIQYGAFLQSIINFLIIAFSIFCAIKFINTVHDRFAKKAEEEKEDAPPTQEELLTEIRDLLKEQNTQKN